MPAMKRTHETPQNALADIALLLLIFFLITTQFPKEDGITATLPPLETLPVLNEVNEVEIWLNANDQVMLENNLVSIDQLSEQIAQIMVQQNAQIRVNLKSHVQSSYVAYVSVYDEIKKAYKHLYNTQAQSLFGKSYEALTTQEQGMLKSAHPIRVFEGDLIQ